MLGWLWVLHTFSNLVIIVVVVVVLRLKPASHLEPSTPQGEAT
jgi:hypothetical protein